MTKVTLKLWQCLPKAMRKRIQSMRYAQSTQGTASLYTLRAPLGDGYTAPRRPLKSQSKAIKKQVFEDVPSKIGKPLLRYTAYYSLHCIPIRHNSLRSNKTVPSDSLPLALSHPQAGYVLLWGFQHRIIAHYRDEQGSGITLHSILLTTLHCDQTLLTPFRHDSSL